MSAGGAFGGNRGARPVPPEKAVFPLDHLHECNLDKKEYIACLKNAGFKLEKCRYLSKKYLQSCSAVWRDKTCQGMDLEKNWNETVLILTTGI